MVAHADSFPTFVMVIIHIFCIATGLITEALLIIFLFVALWYKTSVNLAHVASTIFKLQQTH